MKIPSVTPLWSLVKLCADHPRTRELPLCDVLAISEEVQRRQIELRETSARIVRNVVKDWGDHKVREELVASIFGNFNRYSLPSEARVGLDGLNLSVKDILQQVIDEQE